jgi:hypothetical protein
MGRICSERVARELVSLKDDDENLRLVWEKVTGQYGDRPTAAQGALRTGNDAQLQRPRPDP